MKLGLIGDPLGHSWSPEIHEYLIGADYEKWVVPKEGLRSFLEQRSFDGINVTIPHKQAVMPYLDEIDETAAQIGAVNCILNRSGRLIGYNTDEIGLREMILHAGWNLSGTRCAILGSGGASHAAAAAVKHLGGCPVIISRTPTAGMCSYDELYAQQAEISYLINATPCGMYPRMNEVPADLSRLKHLQGVADLVANPLRTRLQYESRMLGIPSLGGFEMLVRQAFAADELFTGKKLDPARIDACMKHLYQERRNTVLIGMPSCGKSTLAAMLAEATGRPMIEMDAAIEERAGKAVAAIFRDSGEQEFRRLETALAESLAEGSGQIISCGGGIIKNPENMRLLSANGQVIWIRRPLAQLNGSADRPLSQNRAQMEQLYRERSPLYERFADAEIENDGSLQEALQRLLIATGREEIRR